MRCKSCGAVIATGLSLGASGMPRIGPMERACPACLATSEYESADYVPLGHTTGPARAGA